MAFKRPLSVSPPPTPTPTPTIETNLSSNKICKVCGDQAKFHYCGALSCSSCKTFFRRNGFRPKSNHPCNFDGKCVINILTRSLCTTCRLAKCFAVGMNSHQIRKEDLSNCQCKQKQLVQTKALSSAQLPTLSLLTTDQSSLTTSDWTSLSNVVHAFDHFIPITQTRQTIAHLANTPSSLSVDTSQLLSMFTTIYTSIESFIGSSPDFLVLKLDEKSSLHQRNLHGVLYLCGTFIYHLAGMFDCSANDRILISSYGYDTFLQTKRIASQLDYDPIIIKLLLFILAFSSNCGIVNAHGNMHDDRFLHGTFRLFRSQNVYVEVLWKYMVHRYGHYDAAVRFGRTIKHILDLLKMSENPEQNNQMHQDFVEEMTVMTEQSLIISDNEVVPLWGKT